MRICSLLPSATEMLFALGLGDDVVAVSHECDFPAAANAKPRVVTTHVDQHQLTSAAIDTMVRDSLRHGDSLYEVDLARLTALRPDLIVTQELCDVCAIDTMDVARAIAGLPHRPTIVSVHPHTLDDMLGDIRRLGDVTGRIDEAQRVVEQLRQRIETIRRAVDGARPVPAFCLEWLDPLMASGHWMPELVELAGGREVLGRAGQPSRYVTWEELAAAMPERLFVMPCGFPISRTMRELPLVTDAPGWRSLPAVRDQQVYLLNGPSYYNRAGPRLIEGLEILAALLHPDRVHTAPRPDAVARWEASANS